jgi:hypothetical protein
MSQGDREGHHESGRPRGSPLQYYEARSGLRNPCIVRATLAVALTRALIHLFNHYASQPCVR